MFDGSSIAGWKTIDESDMNLMPDLGDGDHRSVLRAAHDGSRLRVLDPPTVSHTHATPAPPPEGRGLSEADGVGTPPISVPRPSSSSLTSPLHLEPHNTGYSLQKSTASCRSIRARNTRQGAIWATAHTPRAAISRLPPINSEQDMRSEMLAVMGEIGLGARKAPPRSCAGPARAWPEILNAGTVMADRLQLYKYCRPQCCPPVWQVGDVHAEAIKLQRGIVRACTFTSPSGTVTSRPSPVSGYAGLSENCLFYIGGIIKHAKALERDHQPRRPTPTSVWSRAMKRRSCWLIPPATGLPRSVFRSAPTPKAKRIETRFPDPTANPYLAFSALLMAGLDGIENKIHPGDAMDKDIYDLPPEEAKTIPQVCGSLREALEAPGWRS